MEVIVNIQFNSDKINVVCTALTKQIKPQTILIFNLKWTQLNSSVHEHKTSKKKKL